MISLRLSARALLRTPGFFATVVLTLALGIGLSTAVFTVANTMLVQRLPVRDQDRIVAMWGAMSDGSFSNVPLSVEEFREFERRTTALESAAFFGYEGSAAATFRENDRTFQISRSLVSGDFFDVLGVQPVVGRTLRPDDDLSGANSVGVISHRLWQERFGGDSAILKRRLVMHETGRAIEIIGVMPKGLDFPRDADLWVPYVATATDNNEPLRLTSSAANIVARLRNGATERDASEELEAFFRRPGTNAFATNAGAIVTPLPELILGDTKPALLVVSAAAAFLLLITCVNVANLVLVRGVARVREVAVRMALGAPRLRVMSQIIAESLVIAIAGAAIGTALAATAIDAFVAFAPSGFPRLDEIALNTSSLFIAIGVTAVSTVLFAIMPAMMSSRVDVMSTLRSGARNGGEGKEYTRTAEMLVGGQIALAVVMLAFAGLIARSFSRMGEVDLAFAPENVLVVELSTSDRGEDAIARMATLDRLLERVAMISGLENVTPTMGTPLSPESGVLARLGRPGQAPDEVAANPVMNLEVVAPNYFETLGVRIIRGRGISDDDRAGTQPVVVVSESAARYHWPGENPIGQTFTGRTAPFTVVGVVADTRYRNFLDVRPSVYLPLRQSPFPMLPSTLLIRTEASGGQMAPQLRQALAEVDPRINAASITPLTEYLAVPLAQPRLNTMLLSAFALTAVILAGIGLFGVIARSVQQRAREFGIRMALGATSGSVARRVVARGMVIACIGALAGLAIALASGQLLSSLLFEVSATDPVTLAGVLAAVIITSALATFLPARAGSTMDPASLLRGDD